MTMSFAGRTAIAGIGATEFSKNSGRSTLRLAVECSDAAIRDGSAVFHTVRAIQDRNQGQALDSLRLTIARQGGEVDHLSGPICAAIRG